MKRVRGTHVFMHVYRAQLKKIVKQKAEKAYSYCNYMRCANFGLAAY